MKRNPTSAHAQRPSKQKKSQGNSLQPVKAVAWAIHNCSQEYVFCHYAEPDTPRLERRGKPTPEARAIPVWISFRDTMLNPKSAAAVMEEEKK